MGTKGGNRTRVKYFLCRINVRGIWWTKSSENRYGEAHGHILPLIVSSLDTPAEVRGISNMDKNDEIHARSTRRGGLTPASRARLKKPREEGWRLRQKQLALINRKQSGASNLAHTD